MALNFLRAKRQIIKRLIKDDKDPRKTNQDLLNHATILKARKDERRRMAMAKK